MRIYEVVENKKAYLPLLLLADEQESMIDRYLAAGTMYVLDDGGVKAQCVVLDVGGGVLGVKSVSVMPQFQRRGYGRAMLDFVAGTYRGQYDCLQVGTGDSPLTVPFYEACGFRRDHVVKDFFTDNYNHEIWEGGVLLRDMVYLRKSL